MDSRQIRDQNIVFSKGYYDVNHSFLREETEILDFIDTLTIDDVFVDIGASGGRFALYAAVKGIETHAYEPEKMNYNLLVRNKELNKLKNLYTYQKALGATNHIGGIINNLPAPGASCRFLSTSKGRQDLGFKLTDKPTHSVEVVTLDSLSHKITALKIDVDGSEEETIAGASNLLKSIDLKQINIELHEREPSFQSIYQKITESGFVFKQKDMIANYGLYNFWFRRPQES